MKNQVHFVCAILATLIFTGVIGAAWCSSNGNDPALQICSGTVEVAVRITNENGEPLRDVTVVATSTKHDAWGFTTETERERIVVDGFFHIVKTEIRSLRLQILKRGYFGETIDYSVKRKLSHIEDISDTGRVVVLERRPTPAPMERIEGILKTNAKGPTTAVKLQPGTRDASPVDREKAGGLDALGGCCFLELQTDGYRIESAARKSQSGNVYHEPVGASLRSTRPGDGFFFFKPQHEHLIAKRSFREMRIAPEDGYAPVLEFPSDAGDRVYFYCRLGGMYGKGFVTRPSLREDDKEATAVSVVKILINPTGDRNVATID